MNPLTVIEKFYPKDSEAYRVLTTHGTLVAQKALETAEKVSHLSPDLAFIEEAAMLHDIGIFLTRAPDIGCHGEHPYICHGYLGRQLLDELGLPRHALVAERHTGVGLTEANVRENGLPVPRRDMVPVTLEEQIICYADKFFSKNPASLEAELAPGRILAQLGRHGRAHADKFAEWMAFFG